MTPREADNLIKSGKPVTVEALSVTGKVIETFTVVFTKRDRRGIETQCGAKFDRASLRVKI